MRTEKKLILEMLSAGKINVTEAEKLLDGIETEAAPTSTSPSINKKFLKVLVAEGNNTKVNINIPVALAEAGLKLIPKDKLTIEGNVININEILNLIQEGNEGELVNIDTMNEGNAVKVKIFIE